MSRTFETIQRYASNLILERLGRDSAQLSEPVLETFPAAVLFADITDFTVLTETLTRNNPRGVEQLTRILDHYIGRLVEIIYHHGGDIVKFAGDAVFALWKAPNENDLALATYRALDCSLKIQRQLNDYLVGNNITLSLRVGLGAGKLFALYVGGLFDRWELLIAGYPMNQVGQAGQRAKPGQVVAAPEVWKLVEHLGAGESRKRGTFCFHHIDLQSSWNPPELGPVDPAAEKALRTYIPRAILSRLDEGLDPWNAEMRQVTVLFLKIIGFSFSDWTPLEEMQRIMLVMQRNLYTHEGSINRFGIDDKGAVLLAAFGLPPLKHDDDPLRALRAAHDLQLAMQEIGRKTVIGIATGRAFCGSVGNETRCEYTMHGSNVNLAARLMQKADTILCDENTYSATKDWLEFEELEPVTFKGRVQPVRIFRPVGERS